jgi:hypothetical protein
MHTSPSTLHYYKNNSARQNASLPQTKLTFRNNNAVLEYKQHTILLPTTLSDEAVMAKQTHNRAASQGHKQEGSPEEMKGGHKRKRKWKK